VRKEGGGERREERREERSKREGKRGRKRGHTPSLKEGHTDGREDVFQIKAGQKEAAYSLEYQSRDHCNFRP
jgi:hypothetical protein